MGDQTKSIQTSSIERSIEHRKHNQLDIMYLHQMFIRIPQLGCLASQHKETLTINELTKPRYLYNSYSSLLLLGLFSRNRHCGCYGILCPGHCTLIRNVVLRATFALSASKWNWAERQCRA